MALHWWSIEVRDGSFAAQTWRDAHGEAMIEAAITHGAPEWGWVNQPWGIVFEVTFAEPEDWMRYRDLPAARAALDAVPDRINGLGCAPGRVGGYPGRGGSAGAGKPRRPRLPRGAGAAPVPEKPSPSWSPAARQPSSSRRRFPSLAELSSAYADSPCTPVRRSSTCCCPATRVR